MGDLTGKLALACLLLVCAGLVGTCEEEDNTYHPPYHEGFDEVNEYGAVRVGYMNDPNLGYDFDGRYIVYSSRNAKMYLVDIEKEYEEKVFPREWVAHDADYPRRSYPVLAGEKIASRGWDAPGDELDLWITSGPDWEQTRLDLPYYMPNHLVVDGVWFLYNDQRYWDELGGSNVEVYMVNLDSLQETRLTEQPMQQFVRGISGDYVVWEDYSLGPFHENVVLHQISTGISTYLTDEDTRQFAPAIHGDVVVWSDLRNGQLFASGGYVNTDIYMHRISTGEETQLTSEEHDQEYPTVHGKWVAWTDLRFGIRSASGIPDTTNVFVYNLETGEEKQVTFGEGYHECMPRIFGDKLIYYSFATGGWGSLWMVDLKDYWPDS